MKNMILIFLLHSALSLFSQSHDIAFYPDGTYDAKIPKVEDVLGFKPGSHPIRYVEMVQYLTRLAESSPLVTLHQEGETHQGRKLYYMIITSGRNRNQLETIRSNILRLSDPRKISNKEADEIIKNSPAVALMMYSIHGNETSGTDAGIQLAYQLAAGTDDLTKKLLEDLVIIIYPSENPDGRERFLSQVETWSGKVPNSDVQSMPHSGVWPSGRTNHYHFDLNRDWFILSQPESRARVKLMQEWNPQLVVDAHEMGSYSSFLFNPPREPINPYMDFRIRNWWKVFAQDQAGAFDRYGWSYYTREWLEEWFPGYGSSYPSYFGAVAILYEQARTSGIEIKRPDGTMLTFADAVHHQFISSISNLSTAAKNRKKLLSDFYEIKKDAVNKNREDGIKTFIINPDKNVSRTNRLIEILLSHGIEVYKTQKEISAADAVNYWNEKAKSNFPSGSVVIPVQQPAQPLINAVMEFDTRMDNKFLKSERESIEKGEGTRLYEVSSWSLPIAFGVDAYASGEELRSDLKLINKPESAEGKFENDNSSYGYLIKYEEDNSVKALITLLENDVKVRSALKPFKVEGNSYDRGTLLIRNTENPSLDKNILKKIAADNVIQITGVNTALSQSGPDLGADQFPLLVQPRIAVLTGTSISLYNYGTIMHLLDDELRIRVTTLNADYFSRYDLRKYNVLIVPSYYGGSQSFKDSFGKTGIKKLNDWVNNGGTLIAIGRSAESMADTTVNISKVRLRRQVISRLDEFADALKAELSYKKISIDSLAIWEGQEIKVEDKKEDKIAKPDVIKLLDQDNKFKRYMPQGAIVKINLNPEHWLCFGLPDKVPALYTSSHVLLSKSPVQTAARIADVKDIRVSGLLWHEAKYRMANASYLTRESLGNGQLILFADEPTFRSYFESTERLFLNSLLLGPGFGTNQTVEW
ncbi:MAG: hypothetical protein JW995_10480 [Melioribacteraceae bacterium]|nr:hypothetical protein [Melioribacteraceae bacterium]